MLRLLYAMTHANAQGHEIDLRIASNAIDSFDGVGIVSAASQIVSKAHQHISESADAHRAAMKKRPLISSSRAYHAHVLQDSACKPRRLNYVRRQVASSQEANEPTSDSTSSGNVAWERFT